MEGVEEITTKKEMISKLKSQQLKRKICKGFWELVGTKEASELPQPVSRGCLSPGRNIGRQEATPEHWGAGLWSWREQGKGR